MKSMVYLFYVLFTSPFFIWVSLGLTDRLGVEPIVTLNIQTGYVTLILFISNLWLGAIFRLTKKIPKPLMWLIRRRRAIGIATGFYAVMHFASYLGKESFEPKAYEQILTKPYLTAAFIAFMILVALLLTSNNVSLRVLGARAWKYFHRSVHMAFILILVHVFLIEKANLALLALVTLPILPFQILRLWKWVRSWQTEAP